MKFLLGRKIGMTQCFLEDGKVVPVTVVHVEPNVVLETKTKDKHGYVSTKVGFLTVKEKSLNKPELGTFKKLKIEPKKYVKEFRNLEGYNVGDKLTVETFNAGDLVDVQAITKGHGFTGAIQRWNFKTGPKSHGAGYPHRYQGSISFGRGGSQGQRVPKGTKMSGHYGHELVTISNLLVVKIDIEKNLILIRGSVPGPKDSLLTIKTTVKNKKTVKPLVLSDPETELRLAKEKAEQAKLAAEQKKQEELAKKEAEKKRLEEEKQAKKEAAAQQQENNSQQESEQTAATPEVEQNSQPSNEEVAEKKENENSEGGNQ
ncbi:MAG: 50S ribosomal protein L3 [Malacoplasma sp.]|nr:50S ribosomal protein L3 [Malacoplasma sp.]